MGRGHCLCREGGRLKPARSKFESLFPEWLFRREKSLSKSQPRKPAIARETRSVARRDCATSALGSWPAVPSPPCGAAAQGTFGGPGQTARPGTRIPHLRGPSPAPRAEADATRVVTGLHNLQRDSSCGLCEGLGHGGGGHGGGRPMPLPVHPVPGSGLWEEAQLATPRKSGGASHCIPRKGAKFPRGPSALHRDHPPQHGLASP